MLRIANFAGEIPRVIPRLLGDNFAQVAQNVRVERGDLLPIRNARLITRLKETAKTIYKDGDNWLGFSEVVSVLPAPIAANRLYIFGDGVPKLRVNGTEYPLAVRVPPNPLFAANLKPDDVDKATSFTVLYAYTWVTAFDEESESSDLSNEVTVDAKSTVRLQDIPPAPPGRNIDRIRIYRSQTSSSGATTLFFIAQLNAADKPTAYSDVIASNPIGEQMSSIDYNQPPPDLKGAVALPNGMMAAFSGKKVYFCEPYIPHAWPEKYILTVDYDIVGLSAFGSSLAIMTTGNPYVAQGTAPENMVMERLRVNLPCVSARGIVDLGYAVAYPSTEGLVTVSQQGAAIASGSLFTMEEWRLMQPESFIAAQYSGRYVFSFNYLNESNDETKGLMMIDLSGQQPFCVRVTQPCDTMYFEIGRGVLYLLQGGIDVYEFDSLSQTPSQFYWKSKRFVLNTYTAFSVMLVEGGVEMTAEELEQARAQIAEIRAANKAILESGVSGGPILDAAIADLRVAGSRIEQVSAGTDGFTDLPLNFEPAFEVRVYGDGKLVFTGSRLNRIMRMPARNQYRTWEIEVRANQGITGITMAYSPEEIASAG